MASPSSTSFERSLDHFRSHLSDDQKQGFKNANLEDLHDTIQKMQAKLGRDKRLCNFRRMEKFLKAMEHIEQLVSIFLNVHEFVAFVWGPIKLALMAATAWTDSIKELIDTYEEIGEALSNLAFFHTLIKSNGAGHLKQALEDYFSDILRFHRCVLEVFSRPNWKKMFKAAWGGFQLQIEPIIRALKLRQERLSYDRLQSHAIHEGVRTFREHSDSRFNKLEAGLQGIRSTLASEECLSSQTSTQDQKMKDLLEDKLNLSRFESRGRLESPERSSPSAGDWIFQHSDFQAWEGGLPSQGNVLFLNGSPGAGKTTLATKVIRYLKSKDAAHGSTIYFFFRHDDEDRRSAKSMLQAILVQLIQEDETILRYLHGKCASMSSNPSLSALQELAQDCLTSQRNVCVVLDGLDECAEDEPKIIIDWFLERVFPSVASRGYHLKLLVCGQRDGRLDVLLSSQPQIRLDTVDLHKRDVEEYSNARAAEICARFLQTPEQGEDLASKVAETAQGMFLYSKVVMLNLLSMDSIQEFEDEMQIDAFPDNLDKAYERIVQRVLGKSRPSRQNSVKKMLGWIICSKRPLRWREIQARFCIDAETGTSNPKYLRRDTCKDICSSLVDITNCDLFGGIQSEEIVHMVHETAGKYLAQRGTIDLLQDHVDMALFCCRYLSSRPFLQEPESEEFQNALRSGYFGFFDYAAVHYSYHIEEAQKHASGQTTDALRSAVGLLKACSNDPSNQSIPGVATCAQTETSTFCVENTDPLIEAPAIVIRAAMESQHHELSVKDIYPDLFGPLRFKCPKVRCSKFATGFQDKAMRDKHLDRHRRPYRCTYTDCFGHKLGFESRESLEAHCKTFHQDAAGSVVKFPSTKRTKAKDIFEACSRGNLEEVKQFHLAGALLDQAKPRGQVTPLYLAAQAGHTHVCKYLVENGANPFQTWTQKEKTGSPMLEAVRQSQAPIVGLFLHTGLDLKDEFDTAHGPRLVALAIMGGHLETLDLLLGAQTNLGHPKVVEEVVKELIRLAPLEKNEPSTDSTLVHAWFRRALPNQYLDTFSAPGASSFIKRSASTEYRDSRTVLLQSASRFLHQALRKKCHPLSMFLLDLADKDDLQLTDDKGLSPIHILARTHCRNLNCEKCPAIMQRVIQIIGSAPVNTPDEHGNLPIHKAFSQLLMPRGIIQILILHTENLNYRDPRGMSLIHCASRSADRINMLLKAGRVDLSLRNDRGQTVFSLAAESTWSGVKILDALFQADQTLAWTSDDTEEGQTPLHYAMRGTPLAQDPKAIFLLTLPDVENVIRAFLASNMDDNDEACREVRIFACNRNLERAIEVMDWLEFGL